MDISRGVELARISLRANWLIVLLIALHMAGAVMLSRIFDFSVRFSFLGQLAFLASTYAVAGVALILWRLRTRPANPLRDLIEDARSWRLGERIAVAAPALLAFSFFGSSFGALKSAIPQMHPYTWDATFAAWDVAIYGQDAWRVIQPLVGHPLISSALAAAYHFWLLAFNLGLVIAFAASPTSILRKQFLIAFILSWTLIGNLAATLLASVGPCFMQPMLGDTRYDDLMTYLRTAADHYPIPVLDVQQMLLDDARQGVAGLGRGISAMPSMHVSITTLLALGMRRMWPSWQWAGWLFLAIIMLGSIHLGYHYAVDGYVSLVLTLLVWAISGRLAGRGVPASAPALWNPRPVGEG
jgi:hypothetical protein